VWEGPFRSHLAQHFHWTVQKIEVQRREVGSQVHCAIQ
jgi:hypothetical protein